MSRPDSASANARGFPATASGLPLVAPGSPANDQPEPLTSAPLDVEAALRGEPLRILFIAAEGTPYVKTGGMADVIGELPRALRRMGHDVRVALPRYKAVDAGRWHLRPVERKLLAPIGHRSEPVDIYEAHQDDGVRVYFIDAPEYFNRERLSNYQDDGDRFILFSRAVMEFIRKGDWAPDVIHCHDWNTGVAPNWLKTIYRRDPILKRAASVYTIHNLAVQGIFGYRILEVAGIAEEGFLYTEGADQSAMVDLMGRGIAFADVVSTVSPRYAAEILTEEFGERLDGLLRSRKDRLYGILNGIDVEEFDPATDQSITSHFDAFSLDQRAPNKAALQRQFGLNVEERTPLVAIISRLNDQKGFDLLDLTLLPLLEQGAQLVVQGTGDMHYHQMLQKLAVRRPRQVGFQFTFNAELSQRIYAGADLLLMPSHVEPCGSTQMYAMRYGCIPVVHRTGGLADTVQDFDPETNSGNGFSFAGYDHFKLFGAVMRALEVYRFRESWRDLMQRAMLADYSWAASAEQYVALYRRAVELRQLTSSRAG
ncbi:MAG TPA: glycogen synthase [Ktedonobacterales bacterium]